MGCHFFWWALHLSDFPLDINDGQTPVREANLILQNFQCTSEGQCGVVLEDPREDRHNPHIRTTQRSSGLSTSSVSNYYLGEGIHRASGPEHDPINTLPLSPLPEPPEALG